jgi:hypothetical protein
VEEAADDGIGRPRAAKVAMPRSSHGRRWQK